MNIISFFRITVVAGVIISFLYGCKKESSASLPVVKVMDATYITSSSAISGGEITSNGGGTITAFGLCVSTSPHPVDQTVNPGAYIGLGKFTLAIKSLKGNTTYYVRAYATNSAGTSYSDEISFKTLSGETVIDIDGNVYGMVKVGNQIWLSQNLLTTKYRNGDPIPVITTNADWSGATTGARCWYANLEHDYKGIGALYNWYAATDSRNVAPLGWHVPTSAEWNTLLTAIYSTKVTNDFTFFYGGDRESNGTFALTYGWDSSNGNWRMGGSWTTTGGTTTAKAATYKDLSNGGWSIIDAPKANGYTIRCIKDQ
jgi:uncharacterized protein (TIGR02145 family)